MEEKFCSCIKQVKRTGKSEGSAIAICNASILKPRKKTLKKFRCRKHPMLATQPLKKGGAATSEEITSIVGDIPIEYRLTMPVELPAK